jgi:hypothetical protein
VVRLGQPREALSLNRQPDLIGLWTTSSLGPPDVDGTVAAVQALTRALTTESAGAPWVLLLTHPYQALPRLPGLRAIRVHYPGPRVPVADGYLLAPDPDSAALQGVLVAALSDAD